MASSSDTVNQSPNPPNPTQGVGLDESSKKKKIIKVNPIFADVVNLGERGAIKSDWTDSNLIGLDGIAREALELQEIVVLGQSALPCLVTGMSEVTAATIINLAWNMLKTGDMFTRMFPHDDDTSIALTISAQHLSHTVINPTSERHSWSYSTDDLHCAQGITYICGSLIRLMTKEATSYMKAIPHLRSNFYKFYHREFPIENFSANQGCLEVLRNMYQTDVRMRNSITGLLYHYNDLKEEKGMCRMLYEQHLGFTGMHAFPLFMQALSKTRLESKELLSALLCRLTRPALQMLVTLINDFEAKPNDLRERKTYKYARIFDPEMFSTLQTKNCTELVCILAYLNKFTGVQGAGNILDIAMIRNLTDESKSFFEKVARNIYYASLKTEDMAEENPMFE